MLTSWTRVSFFPFFFQLETLLSRIFSPGDALSQHDMQGYVCVCVCLGISVKSTQKAKIIKKKIPVLSKAYRNRWGVLKMASVEHHLIVSEQILNKTSGEECEPTTFTLFLNLKLKGKLLVPILFTKEVRGRFPQQVYGKTSVLKHCSTYFKENQHHIINRITIKTLEWKLFCKTFFKAVLNVYWTLLLDLFSY